jgi:hypothetical protein
MITIVDLNAAVGKLSMLHGRRPEMTEAERKASGAFATLAPFRDGNIFSAKFSGDGAWERHPNGDELVQVVAGSTTLHIMMEDAILSADRRDGGHRATRRLAPLPLAGGGKLSDGDSKADRTSHRRYRGSANAYGSAAVGQRRREVALRG